MEERTEALMRIVVLIVSGIILGLWKGLVQLIALIHWIVIVITGKRVEGLAEFCHIWNCQMYAFLKYMTFVTNIRPFPFSKLAGIDKIDLK